jgi:glycolate oxidase iron-sulfur subunit
MDTIRGLMLGHLGLTPRMEEILSTCLMCKACETACPPGVVSHKLILEGRHRAVTQKGLPLAKKLAFRRILKSRKALGRVLSAVARLQRLGPEPQGGPLRHLPTVLSGLAGGRALPPLGSRPLRDRIHDTTPPLPGVEPKGQVALFSGCYLDFVDTPIGDAAIRVLASQGYEVLFPKGQVCCGAPVLYSGDLEDATELALLNARAFAMSPAPAVLTLCATCSSVLREGYATVAEHLQGEDREAVLALSARVQDVSRFLTDLGPLRGLSLPEPLTVTYHDPCHHVRGEGIKAEPRLALRSISGVRVVEMAEPARCCGGGGSFSLNHPDISVEVGRWKVKDILSTGAQAVVTSCPGCILQIQEVAQRERASFEVLHLVELLDRAMPKAT